MEHKAPRARQDVPRSHTPSALLDTGRSHASTRLPAGQSLHDTGRLSQYEYGGDAPVKQGWLGSCPGPWSMRRGQLSSQDQAEAQPQRRWWLCFMA